MWLMVRPFGARIYPYSAAFYKTKISITDGESAFLSACLQEFDTRKYQCPAGVHETKTFITDGEQPF